MKQKRIFYGWWIVLASTLGLMVGNGPVVYTITVFIPALVEEFGAGRGDIALVTTFHMIANAIAMPLAGKLVDRFGARQVLRPSILLWGLGVAAVGVLAKSLFALYLMFAILGVITSGATPLPYGRVITSWFDRRRGLALGIAMSGTGLGTLIIPIIAQHLIDDFGWQIAFIGIGAIILGVALLAVLPLIRNAPTHEAVDGEEHDASTSGDSKRMPVDFGLESNEVLRTTRFWYMCVSFSLVAMAVVGTAAHLFPLMVDRGISLGAAATGISVMGLTLLLARVWAGYLMDRFFAPYVAIAFICGPIIGCLLLASGASGYLVFIAAIGIGLGIGAEVDIIAFLISRYFGLKAFGVLYGYLFGAFLIGGSIGPPLMGYAYDLRASYSPVLYLFVALLIVACILLANLGRYPVWKTNN